MTFTLFMQVVGIVILTLVVLGLIGIGVLLYFTELPEDKGVKK